MEQGTNTGAPMTPTVDYKQKSGKGLKIVTAIACIAAICGIGFGVYGMMQSAQKGDQVSDLKVQIKKDDGTITTVETPKIETTTDDGTTITITDTAKDSGGPYIKDGYFYVPEWGLKFNIPSDLDNYGYSVDYNETHSGYTRPSIGFTAMLKSDIREDPQAAYYDDIETCAIVNVTKESSDSVWEEGNINGIVKNFDDYKLLIWNYSRHGSCDYNLHIDEVQSKIQAMFSNPEKI